MNKCLLTLIATVAITTAYAAADNTAPNANKVNPDQLKGFFTDWLKSRSMTVDVNDQGKEFVINAKTVKDMPNASDLEIASLTIMNTSGRIPGLISLVLRPAGDARVDMVGPQKGSFTFSKGGVGKGLPEAIPIGRYLLTINGEVYGMLVVREDKVVLRQGLKPQFKEGAQDEEQQPGATVGQPTSASSWERAAPGAPGAAPAAAPATEAAPAAAPATEAAPAAPAASPAS